MNNYSFLFHANEKEVDTFSSNDCYSLMQDA